MIDRIHTFISILCLQIYTRRFKAYSDRRPFIAWYTNWALIIEILNVKITQTYQKSSAENKSLIRTNIIIYAYKKRINKVMSTR